MAYDIKTIGDFRKLYDEISKKNYWVLGYFGGGAVNIVKAMELAKQFAEAINVPLETVTIDEILRSSRYKGFKYLTSTVENQEPESDSELCKNVYQLLTD